MRRPTLLLLALLVTGCSAPRPRVAPAAVTPVAVTPVAVTPVAEPRPSTNPLAPAAAPSDLALAPCEEVFTALYLRFEASPRSPAFDAAARAFDRATDAYRRGLFAEAARGFVKAAEGFLAAGDVSDRRWSYGNAVSAWERTNRLGEGRNALLEAATHDPELADELRAMVLDMRSVCPTEP